MAYNDIFKNNSGGIILYITIKSAYSIEQNK